eukprot:g38555.t1
MVVPFTLLFWTLFLPFCHGNKNQQNTPTNSQKDSSAVELSNWYSNINNANPYSNPFGMAPYYSSSGPAWYNNWYGYNNQNPTATPHNQVLGFGYTLTNNLYGENKVVVVERKLVGGKLELDAVAEVGTRGKGGITGDILDPLASAQSLIVHQVAGKNFLLACNAGSSSVSVFRILSSEPYLRLVDVQEVLPSFPVSLVARGQNVYVLSAGNCDNPCYPQDDFCTPSKLYCSGGISRFWMSPRGQLFTEQVLDLGLKTPTVGSEFGNPPVDVDEPLSDYPLLLFSPAQIGLSSDQTFLIVTVKGQPPLPDNENLPGPGNGFFLTWYLAADGTIVDSSQPNKIISQGALPFSFVTDKFHRLLNVEGVSAALSVYEEHVVYADYTSSYYRRMRQPPAAPKLDLKVLQQSVKNDQPASCWVALSQDGKYAFTVATLVGTISSYNVTRQSIMLLEKTAATDLNGPVDMATDKDFLYVIESVNASLRAYKIEDGGELTEVDNVDVGMPPDLDGIPKITSGPVGLALYDLSSQFY